LIEQFGTLYINNNYTMKIENLKIMLELLARVDLKWAEVPTFNEVIKDINNEIETLTSKNK